MPHKIPGVSNGNVVIKLDQTLLYIIPLAQFDKLHTPAGLLLDSQDSI